MDEFKNAMLQLIKHQQEQQLLWEQKYQERQNKFQQEIQARQQKLEEMLLQAQNEQRQWYIMSNKSQNEDSENAFSQNAIWSAIEDFKYAPEEEITFASYFKRYEDLYITDCASWADHKKVRLLLVHRYL